MWIFKQINADSIRISLLFFFLLLLQCCFSCCYCCCFICGAFGSGNCCYATRSNAQHVQREQYGRARAREWEGSCVDFEYQQRQRRRRLRHMCVCNNKSSRDAAAQACVSIVCLLPLPASPSLAPLPRYSVVFLTQIALKIPCTLLSFAIFNGNCTILFSIFFCLWLEIREKKEEKQEK